MMRKHTRGINYPGRLLGWPLLLPQFCGWSGGGTDGSGVSPGGRIGWALPVLILFLAVLLWHLPAFAASVAWTGNGDGLNWGDRLNWSTESLPAANDDVSIGSGKTVTVNVGAGTIQSLASSGTLIAQAGMTVSGTASVSTLSLSGGSIVFNGTTTIEELSLAGGYLGGSGDLTINKPFSWSGGTVSGTGAFTLSQGMNLSGSAKKIQFGRTIVNTGTSTWAGTGDWEITANGVFDNQAGATLDIQGSSNLYNSSTSTYAYFKNAGLVKKTGDAGETWISADYFENNNGTIDVQSGTLKLGGYRDTFNGGTLQTAESATLELSSTIFVSGSIGGEVGGSLRLIGGFRVAPAGATIAFSGNGLEWTGDSWILSEDQANPGTLQNEGLLRISFNTTNLYHGLGKGIRLVNNGTITWDGTSGFNVWEGAVLENRGNFDIVADGDIAMYTASTSSSGTFINSGVLWKRGGTVSGTGTATFSLDVFNNDNGTILVDEGTVELKASGDFNGGILNAGPDGELLLNGTFTLSGTITGNNDGTGNVDGRIANLNSLKIDPAGATLNLTGNGFELAEGSRIVSKDTSQPGTLTNIGILRLSGDNQNTYKLLSNATLANEGTIRWLGAQPLEISSNGVLDNRQGGTLDIQADSWVNQARSSGSFVNSGLVKKTAGAGVMTISLDYFDNNGGTIDVQSGTLKLGGYSDTFNGGTLQAAESATLELSSTIFVSGSIGGEVGGSLRLTGGFRVAPAGATIAFSGNGLELAEGSRIVSKDTSQPGTLTNKGILSLTGDNQNSHKLLSGATLANEGTIRWLGAQPLEISGNGILDNKVGATLEIQADSWVTQANGYGTFNNAGTVVKKQTPNVDVTGTTVFYLPFNNKGGTLEAQAGTVALQGGGEATGGTEDTPGVATFKALDGAMVLFASSYTNKGLGRFSGDGVKRITGRTFTNQGVLIWLGGGDIDLENSAIFDNLAGAELDIQNDAEIPFTFTYPGTLKNAGIIDKTDGPGLTMIGVLFENRNGLVSAGSGELRFSGGGTLAEAGQLNASAGAAVRFTSGTWNLGGTFTGTATGSVELAQPGVFQIDYNGVVFNLSGNGLGWSGGSIGGGQFTNQGGMQITGDSGKLLTANAIMKNEAGGTVVWLGGGNLEFGDRAFFDNLGIFDIRTDADLVTAPEALSRGHFSNRGTVRKTNGTATTLFDPYLDNFGGTIDLQIGTVETYFSNWVDGTINVAAGASLLFTGSLLRMSGTLAGAVAGSLRTQYVDLEVRQVQYDAQRNYIFSQGNLILSFTGEGFDWVGHTIQAGPLTNKGIFKASGTDPKLVTASSAITNEGTMVWAGGTATVNGPLTQTSGSMRLDGGSIEATQTVDIQGGTLEGRGTIKGNVTMAGTISPGLSPGVLAIDGNYTQTSSGIFNVELGGTAPGTGFDRLVVTGAASLGGTLNVGLLPPYVPAGGDTFAILGFGSHSGDFTIKNGLAALGLMKLIAEYEPNNLVLRNTDLACTLRPWGERRPVGTALELAATLTEDTNPLSGQTITFSVTGGPNAGTNGSGISDASGQALFTYTGSTTPGTDTVTASGTVEERPFSCNTSNTWVDVQSTLVPATAKKLPGKAHTLTATVLKNGQPAVGINTSLEVVSGPNAGIGDSRVTDAAGTATFTYTSNGQEGLDTVRFSATADGVTVQNTAMIEWKRRDIELSLVKTALDGDTPIGAGTTLKMNTSVIFTLLISNSGQEDARGVSVLDLWPPELEFVSATPTLGSCAMGTGGELTCELGDLAAGADAVITVEAKTKAAGTVTNQASMIFDETEQNDPVPANNSSELTFQVEKRRIDLSMTITTVITDGPAVSDNTPIFPGEMVSFLIQVQNGGPDTANQVTILDTLAEGLEYVSSTFSKGVCSYAASQQILTCGAGSLAPIYDAPGDDPWVNISARAVAEGVLTNIAVVDFDAMTHEDSQPANNSVFVALNVREKTKGDLDANGAVTLKDAILALGIATGKGLPGGREAAFDTNGDNHIDLRDVLFILYLVALAN